jgi:hypothetical protein
MNSKEIAELTTKAIEELAGALEAGHSETRAQYLAGIGRFHKYSLHNVMLMVLQRAVTCCYTSLESMNMRSCALLEASDGRVAHFLRTIQYLFEYGVRFSAT